MNTRLVASTAIFVVGCVGMSATALGEMDTVLSPAEIEWVPGPPSIPPGAQAAVLYGDPSEEGGFGLRLKLPAGYAIPPHTHPKPENVTVISGTFYLGMGEEADPNRVRPLEAGSFFAFSPGIAHYACTNEETVVQLNSTGPWAIDYVHTADAPRTK